MHNMNKQEKNTVFMDTKLVMNIVTNREIPVLSTEEKITFDFISDENKTYLKLIEELAKEIEPNCAPEMVENIEKIRSARFIKFISDHNSSDLIKLQQLIDFDDIKISMEYKIEYREKELNKINFQIPINSLAESADSVDVISKAILSESLGLTVRELFSIDNSQEIKTAKYISELAYVDTIDFDKIDDELSMELKMSKSEAIGFLLGVNILSVGNENNVIWSEDNPKKDKFVNFYEKTKQAAIEKAEQTAIEEKQKAEYLEMSLTNEQEDEKEIISDGGN